MACLTQNQIDSIKDYLVNKKLGDSRWWDRYDSYGRCYEAFRYLRETDSSVYCVTFREVRYQIENCEAFVQRGASAPAVVVVAQDSMREVRPLYTSHYDTTRINDDAVALGAAIGLAALRLLSRR